MLKTSTDKTECLARKFFLNSTPVSFGVSLITPQHRTESLLSNMPVTPIVSAIVSKLDPNKTCGLDRISSIVLKICAPELAPVRSKLYNKLFAAACLLEILCCSYSFQELGLIVRSF